MQVSRNGVRYDVGLFPRFLDASLCFDSATSAARISLEMRHRVDLEGSSKRDFIFCMPGIIPCELGALIKSRSFLRSEKIGQRKR